jgi:hypothetical protein
MLWQKKTFFSRRVAFRLMKKYPLYQILDIQPQKRKKLEKNSKSEKGEKNVARLFLRILN